MPFTLDQVQKALTPTYDTQPAKSGMSAPSLETGSYDEIMSYWGGPEEPAAQKPVSRGPQPDQVEPGYLETVGKGVTRGFQGLASGVGGVIRWGGDIIGADPVTNIGKETSDYWRKAATEGIVAPDPDLYQGSFLDKPSLKRAVGIISEAMPSLGVGLGAGVVAGPGVLGLLEGVGSYEEAREAGKGVGESSLYGTLSTVGTALLEYLPISRILKGKGGFVRGAVGGGATESATEASQQAWQNLIAKIGYDDTRKLAEGLVESMIGGFGAGGIAGGSFAKLNDVAEAAKNAGVTKPEIDAAREELESEVEGLAEVASQPRTIDDALAAQNQARQAQIDAAFQPEVLRTQEETEAIKARTRAMRSDFTQAKKQAILDAINAPPGPARADAITRALVPVRQPEPPRRLTQGEGLRMLPPPIPDWVYGTGEVQTPYPGQEALPEPPRALPPPVPGQLSPPPTGEGPEGPGQWSTRTRGRRGPLPTPEQIQMGEADLTQLRVADLRRLARENGIDLAGKTKKADIAETVREGLISPQVTPEAPTPSPAMQPEGEVAPEAGEVAPTGPTKELPPPRSPQTILDESTRRSDERKAKAEDMTKRYGDTPVALSKSGEAKGVIIHPSTKSPGKFQTTYWDRRGFSMDTTNDSMQKAINEALQEGYTIEDRAGFEEASKSRMFRKGADFTRQIHKYWEGERLPGPAIELSAPAEEGQEEATPTPNLTGARKATEEGQRRVEAAQEQLRQTINDPDIVGKQRADMVANGRNLVSFLQANAAKDLETDYHQGDQVAYTGEDAPEGFRSFIYLEGNRAGETGVKRTAEAKQADVEQREKERQEQQEGFRRVREAQKKTAQLAQEAANETTGWRDSDRVFISDAYETAQAKGYTGTLDDFKADLITAHRAGDLSLERADLVEAMDPEKVRTSEAQLGRGRFHFVKKAGAKEAAKSTPKAEEGPTIPNQTSEGRWDSAKLGKRVEWLKRGDFVTKKGQITKKAEKMAEQKWADLSPAAQNVLSRQIEEDYPAPKEQEGETEYQKEMKRRVDEQYAGWKGKPKKKSETKVQEDVEITETSTGPKVEADLTKAEEKKLTPKEQKAYLLAEIDKAIEEAPENIAGKKEYGNKELAERYRKARDEGKVEERERLGMQAWNEEIAFLDNNPDYITIEVPDDGTFRIENSKRALREFKKKANKFPVSALKPKAPSGKIPARKPSAFREESIGELIPLSGKGSEGFFTNSSVLIKGKPPKGAKYSESHTQPIPIEKAKELLDTKTRKAKLLYFAFSNPDVGMGVSSEPITKQLSDDPKNFPATYVVFEGSDGGRTVYRQDFFNAIRNRYPNATFKVGANEDAKTRPLVAYENKEPVAIVMPMSLTELPAEDLAREEGIIARMGKTKGAPLPHRQVQQIVNPFRRAWKKRGVNLTVRVVRDPGSLTYAQQQKLDKSAPNWRKGRLKGALIDKKNPEILIFSKAFSRPEDVILTLFHEARGHYSLRRAFGGQLNELLDDVAAQKGPEELEEILSSYGLDFDKTRDRRTAAEEYLARIAESGEEPGLLKRLYAKIREILRGMGVALELTDADLRAIVSGASRRALGQRIDAKGTGEARAMYAGPNAKGANQSALQEAAEMEQAEEDSETIRKETGWFTGMEGKWRFEIDDSEAKLTGKTVGDLPDIIKHKPLFKAYPALKGVFVNMDIDPKYESPSGSFSKGTPRDEKFFGRAPEIRVKAANMEAAKGVILHEAQHAIQEREGFATGGNFAEARETPEYLEKQEELDRYVERVREGKEPSDIKKQNRLISELADLENKGYWNLAGEIEARDTSGRAKLTAEERRQVQPYAGWEVYEKKTGEVVDSGDVGEAVDEYISKEIRTNEDEDYGFRRVLTIAPEDVIIRFDGDIMAHIATKKGKAAEAVRESMGAQEMESLQKIHDASSPEGSVRHPMREASSLMKLMSRFGTDVERSKDMRAWRKTYQLPYWVGKRYPSIGQHVSVEIEAGEARSRELHTDYEQGLTVAQDTIRKNNKAQELTDTIWKWEGKRFPKKEVPTDAIKFGKKNEDLQIQPEHYQEAQEFLKKQGVDDEVASAFLTIRRTLDEKLVDFERTMRVEKLDPDLIEEYRSEVGKIHNYFPHKRDGDAFVRITRKSNPDEVVYREHFWKYKEVGRSPENKARGRAKTWLEKAVKEGKLEGKAEDYTVERPRELTQLPDEVFFNIPVEGMQQILGVAGKKIKAEQIRREAQRIMKAEGLPEDEAWSKAERNIRGDIEKALSVAVSDVLKGRGFGQHAILRQGTPGFETEDVFATLFDYLSGYAGFKTKIQRARAHTEILNNIDAKESPNEYAYASKYVRDVLRNQDRTDRTVDSLRGIFFVKYLGFVPKTAVLNLTQNVVAAGPVLSQYTKGAHRKLAKAMVDTRTALMSKEAWTNREVSFKHLNETEQAALKALHEEGATIDQYLRELKGDLPRRGWGKHFKKFVDKSGLFMGVAEKFNRTSTGLAAFRIGYNEGVEFQGENTKGDYNRSIEFAKEAILDSHFLYGRGNLPEFARGGDFQKYARAAYTFRTFTHNYLSLMAHMVKHQGPAGKRAVAYSLRNLFLIGGLTSIPFFKLASDALLWALGDDEDDAITKAREAMPSEFLKDMMVYGLPGAGAGWDMTGSLSIEVPTSFRDILGIPYAIIEDSVNMVKSLKSGQVGRAFSETPFTPIIVRNAMRGYTLRTEGQRTRSGRNINYPGEVGARKITTPEAVAKALGFQPISSSKSFAAYRAVRKAEEAVQNKKRELADQYVNAFRQNDQKAMDKVVEEVKRWNAEALKDKDPWKIINLKQSIQNRMRPAFSQIPKQMRGEAARIYEAWR